MTTPQGRPHEGSGREAGRGDAWPRGDALDDLLGLDPAPGLSADAVRAIRERLSGGGGDALDALLGLDEVDVPGGLSARVLAGLDGERRATRRRRAFRLVAPALVAAAAAIFAVVVIGGGAGDPKGGGQELGAEDFLDLDDPGDELLAALPALENLEFLIEELDPVEADALLLLDAEDVLALDLLETED